MNGYTGMMQPGFYIPLQVVAHPVCFIHTGILRHYQMEVYVALAACLAGAQFVKIHHLGVVLNNAVLYLGFLHFR